MTDLNQTQVARLYSTILPWVTLVLFALLMIWLPLIRGGSLPIIWITTGIALGGLIFVRPVLFKDSTFPIGLTAIAVLILGLQTLSFGLGLGPCGTQTSFEALKNSGEAHLFPCSFQVGDTLYALLKTACYMVLFRIGFVMARTGNTELILVTFQIVALGFGFIGFLKAQGVGSSLGIGLLTFSDDQSDIELGFVNRNTLATYLSVALVVGIVQVFRVYQKSLSSQQRLVLDYRLVIAALFIVLSSLLLFSTQSGLGVVSGLIGVMFIGAIVLFLGMKTRALVTAVILIAIVLTVSAGIQLAPYIERLADLSTSASIRLSLYRQTWDLIGQAPAFGVGVGTFEAVFHQWNVERITSYEVWNRAHNTYLAILAEQGFVGFLLYSLCFIWIGSSFFKEWRLSSSGFALGGMAILITIGLHAIGDFSMEIFGFAGSVLLILGLLFGGTRRAVMEHDR